MEAMISQPAFSLACIPPLCLHQSILSSELAKLLQGGSAFHETACCLWTLPVASSKCLCHIEPPNLLEYVPTPDFARMPSSQNVCTQLRYKGIICSCLSCNESLFELAENAVYRSCRQARSDSISSDCSAITHLITCMSDSLAPQLQGSSCMSSKACGKTCFMLVWMVCSSETFAA